MNQPELEFAVFAVMLAEDREYYLTMDKAYGTPGVYYDSALLDQLTAAGIMVVVLFDPKRCTRFDPTRYTPAQLQKRMPSQATPHLFLWPRNRAGAFAKAYEEFKHHRPWPWNLKQ